MNMNANFAAMAGQMAAMQQAQTTAQYDAFYHTQLGTMFDKNHHKQRLKYEIYVRHIILTIDISM